MKLFDKFGGTVVLVVVRDECFIGTLSDMIEEPSAIVLTNSHIVNHGLKGHSEAPSSSTPTNAIELMIPVNNIRFFVQPSWINEGPWAKKEN